MRHKAIIFDVDETLIPFISWQKLTEASEASVDEHSKIFNKLVEKQVSIEQAITLVMKNLNKGRIPIKSELEKIVATWELRPGAIELIDFLQDQNITIALITGCIEPLYDSMKNRFNTFGKYNLNTFHWDEAGQLVTFDYLWEPKTRLFNKFLRESKLKPEDCIMIGDGDNDKELFEACDYSILIKKETNKHLEKYADTVAQDFFEVKDIASKLIK